MSLEAFGTRIRQYANKAGDIGDAAVKAAASATLRNLAHSTPVDTGQAVSNWQVEIGRSTTNSLPAYAAGEKGSTADTNRLAMLQAGLSTIDGYRSGEGAAVHIVNNASHIGALNDGHSLQAPRNFVELAVVEGRRAASSIRVSFK